MDGIASFEQPIPLAITVSSVTACNEYSYTAACLSISTERFSGCERLTLDNVTDFLPSAEYTPYSYAANISTRFVPRLPVNVFDLEKVVTKLEPYQAFVSQVQSYL